MQQIYHPTPDQIALARAQLLAAHPGDPGRIQYAAALITRGALTYETAADRNAGWQRLGLDVRTPTDPGWRCPAPQDPRRNQGDDEPAPRWYAVTCDRCQCWDFLAGPGLCQHIYALRLYALVLDGMVAGAATVLDAAPSARYPHLYHLCTRGDDVQDICTATYDPRRGQWAIDRAGDHLAAFAMWLAQQEQTVEATR